MIRFAPLVAVAALAACGPPPPMTPERAARLCADDARAADGISGTVGVGGGSGGPFAGGNVTITNRILDPVPEEEALAACVSARMAGRPPPRPNGPTIGLTLGGRL